MAPEDLATMLGDLFGTLLYRNLSAGPQNIPPSTQRSIKTYRDNQQYWSEALAGQHYEGMRVVLSAFHLMEWLPAAPGRYFTEDAARHRDMARDFMGPHSEYLPLGKLEMVLGGIGSIRLGSRHVEGERSHLLGATSTGISHQGVPVVLPESLYLDLIELIREEGAALVDVAGSVRMFPSSAEVVQYDGRIPRFCVFADGLEHIRKPEQRLLTTVAVLFQGQADSSLSKLWSFCSFSPSMGSEALHTAVEWLKEYIERHSQLPQPVILSDFDELHRHFAEPIEFPIRTLMSHGPDMGQLNSYVAEFQRYGVHLHVKEFVVGDVFKEIEGSTIVNKAQVERSFNVVRERFDDDSAQALVRLAEHVASSGSREAAELFAVFNEELDRAEPRQNVLRRLWNGLTDALPSISGMADVAAKVTNIVG
ncbi:MAG TPA: hypothetical protein VNA57_01935 [Acidimicrobiales bacterium]|nr:hypothetical protein [Acidimicrobiales bacterium]